MAFDSVWPSSAAERADRVPESFDAKGSNGRPRGKARAIDLRTGDEALCDGVWRMITKIEAFSDNWLTEEQAAATNGEGYVYRP